MDRAVRDLLGLHDFLSFCKPREGADHGARAAAGVRHARGGRHDPRRRSPPMPSATTWCADRGRRWCAWAGAARRRVARSAARGTGPDAAVATARPTAWSWTRCTIPMRRNSPSVRA
ncbi:hypothetical protein QJS66_20570 [Kocuria rhizophila]|nr:hypothetical protein QJS66_20570 [Kocuria rhizophila]